MHTQINPSCNSSVGKLSYQRVLAELKQTDSSGDYINACVVDVPQVSTPSVKSILHIGNPYDVDPVIISIPSRIDPSAVHEILSGIVPIVEFCTILTHIASAYQARSLAIVESDTSLGKTLAIETFTKLLYGMNAQPLDFYCVGQTDVSELMGKWVPRVQSGVASDDQSPHSEWEFQLGAVPKAMCGTVGDDGQFLLQAEGGQGCILHVQEIGLAKPAVVDALLRLRGKRGKLADSIQIWEDGGRRVEMGEETFIVMSTNPPESYLDRNELDLALVRASEFLRLGAISKPSLDLMCRRIFTHSLSGADSDTPAMWGTDIRLAKELGEQIGLMLSLFHEKAAAALKNGEPGRMQRIDVTFDDLDRVRSRLIREQVLVTGASGLLEIDTVATLRRAIEKSYISRLSTDKTKADLNGILTELLTGDLGKIEFRGVMQTRAEIFKTLTDEFIKVNRTQSQNGFSLAEEVVSTTVDPLRTRINSRIESLVAAGILPSA